MFLNEPDDKTYYSTMYVRPAKTRVSLCIDPLYKASFLDSPESKESCILYDVQAQSVQANSSLRTSYRHRPMRDLFLQTITLNILGKVFNRHFEILLSFFQENRICISCKLSPLHEMSNPVFLVIKQITIFFFFFIFFFFCRLQN